jgi:mannose-1-phosphate guanylyltransferase / mannose-6-phosphate isomerase
MDIQVEMEKNTIHQAKIKNNQVNHTPLLIPIILCGGAGSRLWPLSREQHPKPFIQLADGESLLQKTYLRAKKIHDVNHILTITNRELLFKITDEYSRYNQQNMHQSFILEPVGKNTAAAIIMAALHTQKTNGSDASILVLPADHLIADEAAFLAAVDKAFALSQKGNFITFGMNPSYPETGFGYIEASEEDVLQFIEKPDLSKAEQFVEKGNYYWNSGMFCFPVGPFLQQAQKYAPDIYQACLKSFQQAKISHGPNFTQIELLQDFHDVPDNSIDYALMEPLSRSNQKQLIKVIPCELGWNDIGSWNALSSLVSEDQNNNRIVGEVYLEKTTNTFVQSQNRVVGLVGIQDLIVVDTADALLVAHKNHVQSVKSIYANLKAKAHDTYKMHRTVYRPWGAYTVLEEGEFFKIKRIEVKPQESLSLQMHYHRSEHWIVVQGMAQVINGDQEFFIQTNESTYIPAGHKHRLTNPGKLPLIMIEVQSGAYLGEDDIVRFEDIYGRA